MHLKNDNDKKGLDMQQNPLSQQYVLQVKVSLKPGICVHLPAHTVIFYECCISVGGKHIYGRKKCI